jgi:hypothetical protein
MIAMKTIRSVLVLLRKSEATATFWRTVQQFFARSCPSGLWKALPKPDVRRDAGAAASWISAELAAHSHNDITTGLYLGLDTLNMDNDPAPYNLEIGGTARCNPSELTMAWVSRCEWHGHDHLIEGLRTFKHVYDDEQWPHEVRDFADYMVPLAYSGIVLAAA